MNKNKNYFALTLNELATVDRTGLDQPHIIIKDVNDRRCYHNWKSKLGINFVTRIDRKGIIRGWKLQSVKVRKGRVQAVVVTPPPTAAPATPIRSSGTWTGICAQSRKLRIAKKQFTDYIFSNHFIKGNTIDMTVNEFYRNNQWLQEASRRYKVRLTPAQVDKDTVRYTVS